MRILVSDQLHPAAIELLEETGEVEFRTGMSNEELIEAIRDKDALLVRSATKVTREVIEAAENLKVIGRAGIGVDNIDLEAATERGIVVVNAPGASTTTVSELTLGLMLALARNITRADSSLRKGRWEKKNLLGVELRGKTLGVIGTGRIGSAVIEKAKAMGMRVIGYDPYVSEKAARNLGFELTGLEEVIRNSDFISLHVPLTDQTYHMIGREEIAMMKDGAFIVNCSRGGTIDEEALLEGLESGKLGGAALDVFEKEPPFDNPLLKNERFIGTPHLGASTEEAQRSASTIAAEEVIKVLNNQPATNVVNMPRVLPEVLEGLKGYIQLGELLGRLTGQLSQERLSAVSITYCGGLAQAEGLEVLTSSVLKGYLSPILTGGVNLMNAGVIAKNRGISVTEGRRDEAEKYQDLIILNAMADGEEVEVKATLLGGEEPRIVGIIGYEVDITPEGKFFIVEHDDRPGMIGQITTELGKHDINIDAMHVGRREGSQLMVTSVDKELKEDILEKIRNIKGVKKVMTAVV
ncbi:MAG: phosphoglycerate dehydrogenase [Euryarchaeota archaeon]|nr:phosphoglycerate dehydrogenase [Euryarchaeota archaeon]